MRRTWLQREVEHELRLSLPRWLRDRYTRGWSYAQMAEELGVSPSTVGVWMRQCGYDLRSVYQVAVDHDLIPTAVFEGDQPRGRSRVQVAS